MKKLIEKIREADPKLLGNAKTVVGIVLTLLTIWKLFSKKEKQEVVIAIKEADLEEKFMKKADKKIKDEFEKIKREMHENNEKQVRSILKQDDVVRDFKKRLDKIKIST